MSKRTKWLLVIGVIAALVVGWQVAAFAVHDTGKFELDGNATNGAAPGDDWDNVCHQVLGNDCSTSNNTTGATAVDWVAEQTPTTSIFTGGGSKDPNDINQWAYKDGSVPDKDNLLHSFAARYAANNGDQLLYFGSDRLDNSGDAQQGFWFFQNPIGLGSNSVGGGKGFTGVHKTGDLLIVSDFSNGGTTSIISVYSWDPTVSGNLKLLATSNAANCASAAANDQFCGIVNPTNGTVAPWPYTDKSGNNTYLQGEFYEGGVNLTKLGLGDKCFSSVASETRSSTSTTATLKDFTLGTFGKCDSGVTTQQSVGGGSTSIGTGGSVNVSDTATVNVSGVPTWNGTVQFYLCGPSPNIITCAADQQNAIGSSHPVSNSGATANSPGPTTVTSVGHYCWSAKFTSGTSGVPDGVDPGGQTECFDVTPVTPTLATKAGPNVTLGTAITDTATLGGTANKPGSPVINPTTPGGKSGGTITFKLFGPSDSGCGTLQFTSAPVPVSGDGDYNSPEFTPTAPGIYHWVAEYSGDSPNTNPTDHNTACNDSAENVEVTSVPSSMTSAQSFIPNDSAKISASEGGALAGKVTFEAFEGTNCDGNSIYGPETVNVSGASPQTANTTNTTKSTTATNISWKVSYDSTNPAQDDISAKCFEKSTLSIDNGGTVTSP